MKFELNILNDNLLEQSLRNLLSNMPDNMLFYKEHNERHPLGVFNVSLNRVYEAFLKFLLEIKSVNQRIEFFKVKAIPFERECAKLKIVVNKSENKEEAQKRISELEKVIGEISKECSEVKNTLLKDYVEILESIMSFIDATYIILKTLYPITTVTKDTNFNYEWLRHADKNTMYNYYSKIKDYRDNLATKVNKIKHNAQNLNFIRFITNRGTINGYYVEGIDPQSGSISPDPEIHEKYNGEYTAISFNYDLKYNILGVFNTIKCLENTINSLVYKKYKTNINISKPLDGDEKWFSILNQIENILPIFFIDEYAKKIPIITTDLKSHKLKFEYTNSAKVLRYNNGYVVELSASGDGITKSFGLPYYKNKDNDK